MKYGKKPARPGAVSLKMSDLVDETKLPTPPAQFGHYDDVSAWGVLGNTQWGDCVWAGAAHEHMLWTREGAGQGHGANFVDANVLSDYAAVTGFDGTDATDQGTDAQTAASYRRKTGVLDNAGNRHRIMAYMELRPGDFDQLMLAAWLFGAAGVGMMFPLSADAQFRAKKPWTFVTNSRIVGGHYVPVVGRSATGSAVCVSWGQLQQFDRTFYEMYCDEAIAYFCPEYVRTDKLSPEGFDAEALGNFLKGINT